MILTRIITLLLLILLIVSFIVRRILIKKNTRYIKGFDPDTLVKEKREFSTNNMYYARHGADTNVINRYVIRHSSYDKSLIVNYTKNFKHVMFFVAEFNKSKKLVKVLKVVEENTSQISKIFLLDKNCEYVNIVVRECDLVLYNPSYIVPRKKGEVIGEELFLGFEVFSIFMIIRQMIGEIMLKDSFKYYFNSYFGLITFLIALLISLIVILITISNKIHKIKKDTLGGKVVYEFY